MYNKVYYFNTEEEANDALNKIKEIAEDYSMISLADVNESCGLVGPYTDRKVGWTKSTIDKICIVRDVNFYSIVLPRPIPIYDEEPKVTYREHHIKKPTLEKSPEPLHITIHTKDIDDVDEILAEIFSHISTVKDRMINLVIM